MRTRLEGRGFADIGPVALLETGAVRLVLLARRTYAVNLPILYTHLGLSVDDACAVVLKTASNFQFFAPWSPEILRVDTPGPTQSDLTALPWRRLPRPIYPLDDLPHWSASGE